MSTTQKSDEIDAADPAVAEAYTDEEIAAMRAILAAVDAHPVSGPMPWSLGGEPPEPQKFADAKTPTAQAGESLSAAKSHTGTDPLGRAVGPKENPKEIKKVRHPETGEVVTPKADGTLPDAKRK